MCTFVYLLSYMLWILEMVIVSVDIKRLIRMEVIIRCVSGLSRIYSYFKGYLIIILLIDLVLNSNQVEKYTKFDLYSEQLTFDFYVLHFLHHLSALLSLSL